jgi:hypothetical protein
MSEYSTHRKFSHVFLKFVPVSYEICIHVFWIMTYNIIFVVGHSKTVSEVLS